MITQIQLRNFKSYIFRTLYLARLTVLVGANASGKLLERFVKDHPGAEKKKQKAMEWLASLSGRGES